MYVQTETHTHTDRKIGTDGERYVGNIILIASHTTVLLP